MAVNQPLEFEFPMRSEEPWPLRVIVGAAVVFGIVILLMVSMPRGPLVDPAWKRHVSMSCHSPACLSPRQFVTPSQADWMKNEMGTFVLDIRSKDEPLDPAARVKPDAHVAFMEPGTFSEANPLAQSPGLEIRIQFANEAEDAMRAAHLQANEPVILVCPSLERSMLAALLLQERGHSRILVLYG
jgi:rhodanese-related sulfurtransferase